MSFEAKKQFREIVKLIPYVVLFILFQIMTAMSGRFGLSMFNGVFSALQYGVCLLMLRANSTKGVGVSITLMGISLLLLLQSLIFGHNVVALPGLFNLIFYIITMIIIADFNRKREEESVTDYLTGIMNRRGLYKHLKSRIKIGDPFNVIYFSIDNFKNFNDTYGHAYGDSLLKNVATRMSTKLQGRGEIARTGGTEFVVVLDGELDAEQTANELLEAMKEKAALVVNQVVVDCYTMSYAGIASFPKDTKDYESLVKYADIAMFEALSKKSKVAFPFDQEMLTSMNRQVEVEKLIKDGLENDYFYMVYQPQYHINGKKLRGFEALIRMKTPEGTFVSPGEFIPVAEKGDMILQIDDYVLRRVMREFKQIVVGNTDLVVSINVSAKNIGNNEFVEKLQNILTETEFNPKNLEIEITEYCMVDSMDVTIANITELRNIGIHIALDDFGTGYTSLNYVAKLPINLLKVDKSLVDDIEKDQKSRDFVNTVVSMGHLMGCEVIAEGVEDEKQLEYLAEDGCDFVQGYVWSKPLEYSVAKKMALENA